MACTLNSGLDLCSLPHGGVSGSPLPGLLGLFFAILGAIALLVITIAGFKYVISRGNPQETEKAKNTIVYAVIGLGISVVAEVLVKFVLDRLL